MLNNRTMHGTRNTRGIGQGGCGCGGGNSYSQRNATRRSTAPYGDPRYGGTNRYESNGHGTCPLCARPTQGDGIQPRNEGNGSPCNPEGMTNCEKLLEQIRAVDFALVELVLYLDAYPHSYEALETYHKLIARRKGLNQQYETSCGPLTAMGNKSTSSWDWIDKPFPWEYKAN